MNKGRGLHFYTWILIGWLVLPIAVMILFGFNDTSSKQNFVWEGFTLKWYAQLFDKEDLTQALINSLLIAFFSTVITTMIGTAVGLALGRYRFKGMGVSNLVLFAAISTPELVMGASLLSMFVYFNTPRGFLTILFAHVMFSIAFVALTVRARVVGMDESIEEASADLGASSLATFWYVTLPMIMPGVVSGAMLAFALSIDDFVITNFTSGSTVTFPLWVWSSTRTGTPPQVNVMGTLIFAVGVMIAAGNVIASRRSKTKSSTS